MSIALSIGRPQDRAAVRSVSFDDVVATYVVDGVLTTRPEIFFPETPTEAWGGLRTPTGDLLVSVGGLVVQIAGTTVLIDAGVGVMRSPFAFGTADCGSMLDVLAALGDRPEDIDVLALTHLHFDHAGWAFANGGRTFPAARYAMAAREWASYGAGTNEGQAVPEHVISELASGDVEFELLVDGEEVVPGVRALVTGGHTPGHTAYEITARTGRRLIAFGDAFHSPLQVMHPDWLSIADTDAAGVTAARRRLLGELSRPDTIGFGGHFGDQTFGRVAVGADGEHTWEPVPTNVLSPPPR